MDNNQFADLHSFATVVGTGSFSRAAQVLGTSTPAVSRSLRRLEDKLGVKLLNRTTRRIGLTDAGRALFEGSEASLHQLQRALAEARGSRTEARGLLRVTSAAAFGRRFVAPGVVDFRMLYPEIEIDLSLSDDLLDLVGSGFDMAIRGGLPSDARLISRRLAPLPLYACASPAFLRRHEAPTRPEDLRHLPCIQFRFRSSGQTLAWEFAEGGRRYSIAVDGPLTFDDPEAVCAAAVAGVGIAQVPGYLAAERIRRKELVPLLTPYLDSSRFFAITYLHRAQEQPLRDRLFAKHLATLLSDPQLFMLAPKELRDFARG